MNRRSFMRLIPGLGLGAVLPEVVISEGPIKEVVDRQFKTTNVPDIDVIDNPLIRRFDDFPAYIDPRCPPGTLYGMKAVDYKRTLGTFNLPGHMIKESAKKVS